MAADLCDPCRANDCPLLFRNLEQSSSQEETYLAHHESPARLLATSPSQPLRCDCRRTQRAVRLNNDRLGIYLLDCPVTVNLHASIHYLSQTLAAFGTGRRRGHCSITLACRMQDSPDEESIYACFQLCTTPGETIP